MHCRLRFSRLLVGFYDPAQNTVFLSATTAYEVLLELWDVMEVAAQSMHFDMIEAYSSTAVWIVPRYLTHVLAHL